MGLARRESIRMMLLIVALMALCNLLLLFMKFNLTAQEDTHDQLEPDDLVNSSLAETCPSVLRTLRDVRRCYPADMFRQLPDSCQTIETWDDIQRCLTGRLAPLIYKIEAYTVHIVGERNSGTKWLVKELQNCFPVNDFHFIIKRDFYRSKHWFQLIHSAPATKSIVVSIFRNPVEWVAAMRAAPYHSPTHLQGFDNKTGHVVPLPWREFVDKVWTTNRSAYDLQLLEQSHANRTMPGVVCRGGFAFDEVMPCQFKSSTKDNIYHIPDAQLRGYEPVYELRRDHSGNPFDNILDLRREKNVHFALELPLLRRLGGYAAVRYEDMLQNGTRFILEQIADILGLEGLPANCQPAAPQPERLGKRGIDPDFRSYVESHVDVPSERLLGYMN